MNYRVKDRFNIGANELSYKSGHFNMGTNELPYKKGCFHISANELLYEKGRYSNYHIKRQF